MYAPEENLLEVIRNVNTPGEIYYGEGGTDYGRSAPTMGPSLVCFVVTLCDLCRRRLDRRFFWRLFQWPVCKEIIVER